MGILMNNRMEQIKLSKAGKSQSLYVDAKK